MVTLQEMRIQQGRIEANSEISDKQERTYHLGNVASL